MRKYNKFLILLLCIALSFLVSCMNEGKSDTDTTEKQPDGVLTDAVNTEAIATSAPVTTALQEAERCVDYSDEFYYGLMYETDEQGNWVGFGRYIINYEPLGDIGSLLLSRSQEAYNEMMSVPSDQRNWTTLLTVLSDFKEDVKLILQINHVEYEVVKLDKIEHLQLKQNTDAPVTNAPVTNAPVTSAPVTTKAQEEPSQPDVEYDDEILLDLMYQTDDDGKWSGFGKYIANYEEIDEVDYLLVLRSQEAYDEANSILNGEADKTITDLYESFKSDIKLILRVHSVEFTEKDVLGYEVIKLQ